jgi:glutamate racemase
MKLNKHQPIGIFDSGIGGLTVANAVSKLLPNEQLIYFGDTAHLPYGEKSPRAIKQYAYMIADFLLEHRCKAIVIACNTASAIAYSFLKELYKEDVIVFSVIDPVIHGVIQDDSIKKVGIIGTQATIKSNVYETRFKELKPELEVISLATPLLAPMIEAGFYNNSTSETILRSYLEHDNFKDIDALILACTHYPLIKEDIRKILNPEVRIIDNIDFSAREIELELKRYYLLSDKKSGDNRFYVSDYTESFERTTKIFYKEQIHLELANIWKNT